MSSISRTLARQAARDKGLIAPKKEAKIQIKGGKAQRRTRRRRLARIARLSRRANRS